MGHLSALTLNEVVMPTQSNRPLTRALPCSHYFC